MSILEEIADKTRVRIAKAKEKLPLEQLQEQVSSLVPGLLPPVPRFEQALSAPGISFICEVKKASPSKGIIAQDFNWLQIAKEYEQAGAAAISILTEPEYFLGSDEYLQKIAATVSIPTLRKDFTIDPYQIYEAKLLGAEAVLLICALLDAATLSSYIQLTAELGLSALVEIHNKEEAAQAVSAGARIIGINNRDLKTFKVDFNASAALREQIPPGILAVAESGIRSKEDVRVLRDKSFDAVLIGESLMRSPDKRAFLQDLSPKFT